MELFLGKKICFIYFAYILVFISHPVSGGSISDIYTTELQIDKLVIRGTASSDRNWGGSFPDEDNSIHLEVFKVSNSNIYGCNEIVDAPSESKFALYILRGICDFSKKVLNAQKAGALAVIIGNTVESIYNESTNASTSALDKKSLVDCNRGRGTGDLTQPPWSEENNLKSCSGSPKCESNRCIPTDENNNEVCCIWDAPIRMGSGISADNVQIPAMFISSNDGTKLESLLPTSARMFNRNEPIADPASLIILFMATGTVILASYLASSIERKNAFGRRHGYTKELREELQQEEEEKPSMEITKWHAIGFIVFGSAFLLLLFYVQIVMVVIVLFALGSISAIAIIIIQPSLDYVFKKGSSQIFNLRWFGEISLNELLSIFIALGIVVWWFIERNSSYSWVLQDIFGICFCLTFLQVIRLPNIKIATLLLVLAFLYDIFFVFISPYIWEESVMIRAAQGGKQDKPDASDNYCLLYPEDSDNDCVRESIPILLRVPKLLTWKTGYAMLGLGDIVLPGLLLAYCARYDYMTRGNMVGSISNTSNSNADVVEERVEPSAIVVERIENSPVSIDHVPLETPKETNDMGPFMSYGCPGYFGYCGWMCIGYFVGLLWALIMVIVMKKGQPALLYLVPTTLGLLIILAWRHGDLKHLWNGPKILNSGGVSMTADSDNSRSENAPINP